MNKILRIAKRVAAVSGPDACKKCHGTGFVNLGDCLVCGGTGRKHGVEVSGPPEEGLYWAWLTTKQQIGAPPGPMRQMESIEFLEYLDKDQDNAVVIGSLNPTKNLGLWNAIQHATQPDATFGDNTPYEFAWLPGGPAQSVNSRDFGDVINSI